MPETAATLLDWARKRLVANRIETASLDARLLLQYAAGLSHEALAMEPQAAIGAEIVASFKAMILRRLAGEPVSRIIGIREFHGRAFRVTPDVLDPRPDTETLIGAALAAMPESARLLDLGTGSGAIAVTLLAERPDAVAVASDISLSALDVARSNANAHGVASRLVLVHGNWYQPVAGEFDLILSNPPYIPLSEIAALAPDVRNFDPHRALDGGPDGLEAYRRIAAGARERLRPGGSVIVEIGAGQGAAVNEVFSASGFAGKEVRKDLAGRDRCLTFRLP